MNFVYKSLFLMMSVPIFLVKLTLLLLIFALLILLYQHATLVWQKKKFWLLLISIFLGSILWYVQTENLKKKRAFVVKESVCVYAGPEKSFHNMFQLSSGTSVQVLKTHHEMSQILVNGQKGWVFSDQIEVI